MIAEIAVSIDPRGGGAGEGLVCMLFSSSCVDRRKAAA